MRWRLLPAAGLLVAGALLPMNPASTWIPQDADDTHATTGAPAAVAGPDTLVDARRAAGEAATQAGFLTQGTAQLKDGVVQLDEGSKELIDGISAANTGAQQLSNGMVELQAGTGQLADGATRVADAIGGVVDQAVGFDAVRGQVIAGIDGALLDMRDARDPDVVSAREALTQLRQQALTAELPADVVAQLNELKTGSREVANQLSVPGYAYHDGIYTATKGAQELASGLGRLDAGAGEAGAGIGELRAGTEKLDQVAGLTSEKIDGVRRAIPAASPLAGGAVEGAPRSALAPLAAMLISALLLVGGFAAAAASLALPRRRWWVLAGSAAFTALLGWVLVAILGVGMGPAALALAGLASLAAAFGSAGIARVFMTSLGARAGSVAAAILVAAQVALVGWVWKVSAAGVVPGVVEHISSALPMHWSTAALSAAGNGGSPAAMWAGIALGVAAAVIGLAVRPGEVRAPGR
ncbi:hypothetical protein [Corynebacterium sp.]|uniref:hypothetical protein n=1 Tax=Corynebacterium sp. TaxID=1720 RepID=UPI002A915921|nr:hypothetical protein [Corynebacterium sp.]MDY5785422.1 hypothetical protein [Corynebacterium sp.]